MRERKAARLLVINPAHEVLLFRFVHKDGALAGKNYWATPGGGVEAGRLSRLLPSVSCARKPVFRCRPLQRPLLIVGLR